MQLSWNVTYEIVTYESAEHGDAEERGFVGEHGIKWPIEECREHGQHLRTGTLSDLIHDCENFGVTFNKDTDWLYCVDGRTDYRTGAVTTYAVHLETETAKRNAARIGRLIERKRPFATG